ncbi:hypothetical protein [Streptomyces sp. NBC_01565]|uniref:hypothetical protein n=1 Tax=Streptomyces sp. NBC_01565 TaxID=2975881 RepID=UPI0022503125|nr:hypothetical protein [Streptomyces sp. NBC_01565]MCX4547248.1 hypothetical protein [Streptomyces sp. NBC_01565]
MSDELPAQRVAGVEYRSCEWCGAAVSQLGTRTPRLYCKRSHRQRAYDARRYGEPMLRERQAEGEVPAPAAEVLALPVPAPVPPAAVAVVPDPPAAVPVVVPLPPVKSSRRRSGITASAMPVPSLFDDEHLSNE